MGVAVGLLGAGVLRERQRGAHDRLRVALADVDDVDDLVGHGERAPVGVRLADRARRVERRARRLRAEAREAEALEQAGLPELVADVLRDVDGVAVGAHEDDVGLLEAGQERGDVHDEGSGVLALRRPVGVAALLEHLEALVEEAGLDDVRLPHEQVVLGAEGVEGLELSADHALYLVPELASLQAVHDLGNAALDRFGVALLGLTQAHVELAQPVVVLALDAVAGPVVAGLEVGDGEDALGRLPARVVDVVLDLDVVPHGAQDPRGGVAEHDVAQVPDVRLLVRVDARVLHDDLPPLARARGRGPQRDRGDERAGVEYEVDVGPDRLRGGHAGRELEPFDDLLRDLGRRAPQRPGQGEGERGAVVARLVGRDLLERDVALEPGRQALQGGLQRTVQLPQDVVHDAPTYHGGL